MDAMDAALTAVDELTEAPMPENVEIPNRPVVFLAGHRDHCMVESVTEMLTCQHGYTVIWTDCSWERDHLVSALPLCRALVLLDGWEGDYVCKRAKTIAEASGIPVVEGIDALPHDAADFWDWEHAQDTAPEEETHAAPDA